MTDPPEPTLEERYERHHALKLLFLEEWKSQQLQCHICGVVLSFGKCPLGHFRKG